MASYASTVGTDVAKAGWLYRRTTILHRWKKEWFVLDRQGNLRYFESPDSPKAEERIVVRAYVTHIKSGPEARRSDPPEGLNIALCGFLELVMREHDNMVLCAETFDDIKAWQVALEEARAMPATNMVPGYAPMAPIAPVTYVSGGGPSIHIGSGYNGYGGGFGYYGPGLFSSPAYSGQVISTTPFVQQQVYQTPTGTTVVQQAPQQVIVVDDDPWRYRHRYGRPGYRRNHWW